jgi:hypothetical protein
MQLITNRIHTGKAGRFEDFIEKYRTEHQVKIASMDVQVKVAAEQEEADSSGQLKVEPLHQKGESTEMPKKGPSAKKEGKDDKKSATTDTKPEKEGKDSGQPKAEGSEKLTNKVKFDPNDTSKEEKGGSVKTIVKEAKSKCEKCGKECGECACKDCDCKACTTARAEAQMKEAGKLPAALEEYKFTKKDDKKDDKKEDDGKGKTKVNKDDKVADQKLQFVKWANLDSKNKAFLTKYWRQLFGDDYVNALVTDK